MIGRHDITFHSETPSQVTEGAVRLVRTSWHNAIVENAETGELLASDSLDVTELPAELLIYKDASARDSWRANGAIPENANLMVHFLRGNKTITIVVDAPGATDISSIVNAIREHIYQDIFWIRADAA